MSVALQRDSLLRLTMAVTSLATEFHREGCDPDPDKVLQLGIVCAQLSTNLASMAAQQIIESLKKK